MTEATDKAIGQMLAVSWASRGDANERAATRCGLGDAAGLCDALADIIRREHATRGGKGPPTKRGEELALVAKRCGDAIWRMRDFVKCLPNPSPGRKEP